MKLTIAILMLFMSVIVAGIAGWFSVVGMMALFGGSTIGAAIFMSALELAKFVSAAWVKVNWQDRSRLLVKTGAAFVIAVMLLTSLGIFGYLSKAHIEQGAPTGNSIAQIERLDNRISRAESKITSSQNMLDQLDAEVNTLIKYDKISRADGSKATRAAQKEDRTELNRTIDEAEANITVWSDEKFELAQGVRAYEVEVGPVKYIAEIIYGDKAKSMLDAAVRAVIIMIIFVFDPFAIWMLVAANHSLLQLLQKTPKPKVYVDTTKPKPKRFSGKAAVKVKAKPEVVGDVISTVEHTEGKVQRKQTEPPPNTGMPPDRTWFNKE